LVLIGLGLVVSGLGLGLGLAFFGLGLGLGLALCGLVNITDCGHLQTTPQDPSFQTVLT